MLEATLREANELYVFFSLLAKGEVDMGDAQGGTSSKTPIVAVVRHEHDGLRRYAIETEQIKVTIADKECEFPREDFAAAAEWILQAMQQALRAEGGGKTVVDFSDIEPFLDAVQIFDMESQTEDRTHLHLQLWHPNAPLVGIRIQSSLCGFQPILAGGRTSNIKFEQTGVRFSNPAVHKINWTEQADNVAEVGRRILYIQSLGGQLKFNDVADKIFKSNLLMIDTNLPRILSSMLMTLFIDGTSRVDELTALMEEKNPLKVKEELVRKHGFYAHKMRELLLALAWGMRPTKQYQGKPSAVSGYLMVDKLGVVRLYTRADEQTFADYLFHHTRLEKGLPDEDKYGYLERENGVYYLKLNLKIGLLKR